MRGHASGTQSGHGNYFLLYRFLRRDSGRPSHFTYCALSRSESGRGGGAAAFVHVAPSAAATHSARMFRGGGLMLSPFSAIR
jgi:hypothetical protein